MIAATLVRRVLYLSIVGFVVFPVTAHSAIVSWTDWTSATGTSAIGTLTLGSTPVGVTFSGTNDPTVTQTSGGTNYWVPTAPYISSLVSNAPPAADIIALDGGETVTIMFSQAVVDPLIALVSWNGIVVDFFGLPIEILSSGTGFWGTGSAAVNSTGTGFTGVDELHGVVRIPGIHSSIRFSHSGPEFWHGFTVGAVALHVSAVPEPGSLILVTGIIGAAGIYRRRRNLLHS